MRIIAESGLHVVRQTKYEFRPLMIAANRLGMPPFRYRFLTKLDRLVCSVMPYRYHTTSEAQKIRFTSMYFVLRKPATF